MELKKGMYVITTDRLEIGKIIHFCECESCKERGFDEPILDNPNMFITNYDKERSFHGYKFYESLIDLIEVGDYVNGLIVNDIVTDIDRTKTFNLFKQSSYFGNEDIKSIVTKEQMEAIQYVVK